jgi:hypothetical protein
VASTGARGDKNFPYNAETRDHVKSKRQIPIAGTILRIGREISTDVQATPKANKTAKKSESGGAATGDLKPITCPQKESKRTNEPLKNTRAAMKLDRIPMPILALKLLIFKIKPN